MNKNKKLMIAALVVALGGASAVGQTDREEGTPEQREMENYLRKAGVVSVLHGVETGRGQAWRVSLELGSDRRSGFFKYVDFARPRIPVMSYRYERAAYALTKLLGIDIVPPGVERTIEGKKGWLQIRVEGCFSGKEQRQKKELKPPDPAAFENSLEEVNVFENLTYCERSNAADLLIHESDWRVCRVDFAEAFEPVPDLLPSGPIRRCSRRLFQALLDLRPSEVQIRLDGDLNKAEMTGLLERRDRILDRLRVLIKEKGESAVIFEKAPPKRTEKK